MKIIAVDIGNTTTTLAVVENRTIKARKAIANDQIACFADELQALVETIDKQDINPVVVCSVEVDVCKKVAKAVKATTAGDALVIGEKIPLPIKLDLSDASTVGNDRVVEAAMASERMEGAVVIADFGTAITIDCVNDEDVFLGGAILPGLKLAAMALNTSTSALPLVDDLKAPQTAWGRNTEEAISAGLIFGAVGALREIVERYASKLEVWPPLVLTGGDVELIAKHCDFAQAIVPDLVLMGIELAYDRWLNDTTE